MAHKDNFFLGIRLLLALLSWALFVLPGTTHAQTPGWSEPLYLFETEGRASEAEIAVDPSGVVHVFWAYAAPGKDDTGANQAIYYSHKKGDTWSEPLDVLVSPRERVARMHAVQADSQGYLHIVWSGGDTLYYSHAYAPQASSAGGWITPVPLISGASATEPAIVVGSTGEIYVLWTQANSGLAFASSPDGGQNWSTPKIIFVADGGDGLARWGRIAIDDSARIHVAFTYTINDSSARYGRIDANLLYYLRSEDQGTTWSEPILMTPDPDFGEINVATCGDDVVHLVWNGRAGRTGRYHRYSLDGGDTWSDVAEVLAPAPQNPIGTGGLTGFPVMVCDSTKAIHMVTATGSGMYSFMWRGGAWTPPEYASRRVVGGGVTGSTESIEQPSLALSQGNQLHLVFHDGFERIWYVTRKVDAPFQDVTPLPAPPTNIFQGSTQTPPPAAQPTPQLEAVTKQDSTSVVPAQSSQIAALQVSTLSVLLLVGGVLWVHLVRRKGR